MWTKLQIISKVKFYSGHLGRHLVSVSPTRQLSIALHFLTMTTVAWNEFASMLIATHVIDL